MSERFTIDGSEALEQHLTRVCDDILAGVRDVVPARLLEALLLAGGYGRGEGGVLRTPEGDRPYNDLEFYVFVRGSTSWNEKRFGDGLHWLSERIAPVAGVNVEFKVTSLRKMKGSPVTMFSYDLMMGHRCLMGSELLLAGGEHHCMASQIPLSEATRLLMNRFSGLLFALDRLRHKTFTDEDADFVRRNLAKAQMSLGDAVLAVFGEYHWSCRKRHQRLEKLTVEEELPWLETVQQHHMAGMEFKLHPNRSGGSPEMLAPLHQELTSLGLRLWLWLENRRLKQQYSSAREYALDDLNKCPEEPTWHNVLANVKPFGVVGTLFDRGLRYPRERLLQALALLLWETRTVSEPTLLRRVQRDLRANTADFHELVKAYVRLWQMFN